MVAKQDDASGQIGGAQAIRRAVGLLRAVAMTQRSGANLATLARATQLSRSTAFRILHSLSEEGLLDYDVGSHCYALGPLAYELGLAAPDRSPLISRWSDRLARVRNATGMTTYLVARSDLEIVCLATLHGLGTVRAVPLEVGDRLPLGIGGGSLAILASLDDNEVAAVIAANANRLPLYGGGKLSAEELYRRVATTRSKGYSCSRNAAVQGVVGIGMRVADQPGLTQLAISISIPASELSPSEEVRLAGLLRENLEPPG